MGKKVTIRWHDTLRYGPNTALLAPTLMETRGTIVRESEHYIVISDPVTMNSRTKKKYPKTIDPTFFSIPKGMIESIEPID